MIADLVLPAPLPARIAGVMLRRAVADDLDALMRLLADDPVSGSRGDVADPADAALYRDALARIVADPANELLLAVDAAGSAVGTMQLTRIPGMARRGTTRLQVEAVRVRSDVRSAGIGSAMMRWVTDAAAPALGSTLVQLTSDAARTEAHRFYERLGFQASHVGFKRRIPAAPPAPTPTPPIS